MLTARLHTLLAGSLFAVMLVTSVGCAPSPSAYFVASDLTGQAPLSVTFTNQSENSDTFEWDFGDGRRSAEISPSHTYTRAGEFSVTLNARQSGKTKFSSASATIKVEPGPLAKISVRPETAELLPQQTMTFGVKTLDSSGNEIQRVELSWSATGGTVDPKGVFTAGPKAGKYPNALEVRATQGSVVLSSSAAVTIRPDVLDHVELPNSSLTLTAGEKRKLVARAVDKYGNEVGEAQLVWSVIGVNGSIDEAGNFAAPTKAGSFPNLIRVHAQFEGITKEASLSAIVSPASLASASILPANAVIFTKTQQQFSATGADQFGNSIPDLSVKWEADSNSGTIQRNGILTARRRPGTYPDAVKVEIRQGEITQRASASVSVRAFATVKDAAGDCCLETGHTYMDIVEASIAQIDGNNLQFSMKLNGAIPERPSSQFVAFVFFLDLNDNNKVAEFPPDLNVRVGFDYRTGWFGRVDSAPPGGAPSLRFDISGASVTVTLPLRMPLKYSRINWYAITVEGTTLGTNPAADYSEALGALTTVCVPVTLRESQALTRPSQTPGADGSTIFLVAGVERYDGCGSVTMNGGIGDRKGTLITPWSASQPYWDWGDGSITQSWYPATHYYSRDGTYSVKVTAYTDAGDAKTIVVPVTITTE